MPSWMDSLPGHEREKIRRRMRSAAEYERLREKVKGPEDLERELNHNAEFAEAALTLETDPKAQERSRETVKAHSEAVDGAPEHLADALKRGQFDVVVDHQGHEPKLAIKLKSAPKSKAHDAPTGKVQEVYPLKTSLQQQVLSAIKI